MLYKCVCTWIKSKNQTLNSQKMPTLVDSLNHQTCFHNMWQLFFIISSRSLSSSFYACSCQFTVKRLCRLNVSEDFLSTIDDFLSLQGKNNRVTGKENKKKRRRVLLLGRIRGCWQQEVMKEMRKKEIIFPLYYIHFIENTTINLSFLSFLLNWVSYSYSCIKAIHIHNNIWAIQSIFVFFLGQI